MSDAAHPLSTEDILHASCVAIDGHGVLILGASGQGKSTLALDLISRGATLVADDRTRIQSEDGALWARAPGTIAGRIEARGVGILNAPCLEVVKLALVVDLDRVETERLPERQETDILGVRLPVLARSEMTCFPAAVILYVTHGRYA